MDIPAQAIIEKAEANKERWWNKNDLYWFARLMQEAGELGSVIVGDHKDTVEYELIQIGSIALNWLRKRGLIRETALREPLSDTSHEIWSSWMRWMFTVGALNKDGSWTMPAILVERWQRQMNTPYAALSEQEKDSDREQADKILSAINEAL